MKQTVGILYELFSNLTLHSLIPPKCGETGAHLFKNRITNPVDESVPAIRNLQ